MAKLSKTRLRRLVFIVLAAVGISIFIISDKNSYQAAPQPVPVNAAENALLAINVLKTLEVKNRSLEPKYSRDEFGSGWGQINGCDTRNVILQRDLANTTLESCLVMSGTLNDPYTSNAISFTRGEDSNSIQIDHVVALSDAWQKGAASWDKEKRKALANDPLELLAVDGPANQQKSDGDASSWLPPNQAFHCEYVARQIAIKAKYLIWITEEEHNAMSKVLSSCPNQTILQ